MYIGGENPDLRLERRHGAGEFKLLKSAGPQVSCSEARSRSAERIYHVCMVINITIYTSNVISFYINSFIIDQNHFYFQYDNDQTYFIL